MRPILGALLSIVLVFGATGCTASTPAPPVRMATATPAPHAAAAATDPAPSLVRRCSAPAPTSATGYRRMFDKLPASQWGAADVAISTRLPDGRVLWLFGDTFSAGRFVHSSAIVQDRGCLHVVNGGAQILPNLDARHIFWIDSAEPAIDGSVVNGTAAVLITARAITLTGKGPWDFRDGGYSQIMALELDQLGDATGYPPAEYGWGLVSPLGPSLPGPAPDPGPMYAYGPHHFGYARHPHPEAHLASGRTLVTTCQNWDDGHLHPLADYRPIFTES